jgi:nucleotide-binding universal stress UspA family protein
VTDKVVQAAETPVLIIRSHPPRQAPELRRVMLALDGSDLARQALPIAAELAESAQAELILFQAIATTAEAFPYPRLPADVLPAMRDKVCQDLEALADELRPRPMAVTPAVTFGYPAEAIVEEAQRRDVDLIVMATHGRSGLRRWALGSVAGKVLHATTRPLLLVRG